MNWFRRRKAVTGPTSKVTPSNVKAVATSDQPMPQSSADSVILQPIHEPEPNYDRFEQLQLPHDGTPPEIAPLLIVGVGQLGQAVLESLARWVPSEAVASRDGVRLMVVQLEHERQSEANLLGAHSQEELPIEYHELPSYRGSTEYNHDVYGSAESKRTLGHDALLRELHDTYSTWDVLQRQLNDGRRRDIWLVGSSFDTGSGLIFDLAHLACLVATAQNYVPFVGWLLALPGEESAEEHQAQAAATIRELLRLLRIDVPRLYGYDRLSGNSVLRNDTEGIGKEDARMVLLCEPPHNHISTQAINILVSRMALALLALMQTKMWNSFRATLPPVDTPGNEVEYASASTFGVAAQFMPLKELQELVRARLTRDALIERDGILQPWRQHQIEPNIPAAQALLQQTGHELLTLLAQAGSVRQQTRRWPSTTGMTTSLAAALRWHLQDLVDSTAQVRAENGLAACEALLLGLQILFDRAHLPPDVRQPLDNIVVQSKNELRQWIAWRRVAYEKLNGTLQTLEQRWRVANTRPNWHSVLSQEAPQNYYEELTARSDIREKIRNYIRWAWLLDGSKLVLRMDTLFPAYHEAAKWRHGSGTNEFSQLWEGANRVVRALTNEPAYWPTSLSLSTTVWPSSEEVEEAAGLMLSFNPSGRITRLAWQASGDHQWLQQRWLRRGQTLQVDMDSSTLGLLFQVHHGINLGADLTGLPGMMRQYASSRRQANSLHIFDAERRAALIEESAFANVPRRQRQNTYMKWISSRTVADLQWPWLVDEFVLAWLAGQVEPASGPGPYHLQTLESRQEFNADHPIDVLHQFVSKKRHATIAARNFPIAAAPQTQLERVQSIDDWWRSPDHRDCDWYILVHGSPLSSRTLERYRYVGES